MNQSVTTGRYREIPAARASQLLLPRPSLAGCLFAAVIRDTRRLALAPEQRANFFPASPLCSVTWYFEGSAHLITCGDSSDAQPGNTVLPELFFTGPHTGPLASWNDGPIHAMTVTFYPEAWQALTGKSIEKFINKCVPLDKVAQGEVLALLLGMATAGSCVDRFHRLEAALEPLWLAVRPSSYKASRLLRDWTKALAVRAALSKTGRSTRQIQRRIKSLTGQSQRNLRAHAKSELLFEAFLAARGENEPDGARLAVESGFADQSHMVRHIRRATGQTPARLAGLIEKDERFWCYRLFGEIY